jgi:WD40 repeat protein
MHFSPDGSLLASLDREGTLFVWQMAEGSTAMQKTHFQGNSTNADFWNLVFSPDSRLIAVQLEADSLGIFGARAGWLRCTVAETLYGVGSLAFSRDNAFLITGSEDGRVRVWDAATGALQMVLAGHEGIVHSFAANLVDGRVASGGDDGVIRIWDIETGTCELTLTQPRPYEGLDITGASGLSPAQAATLQTLGAVIHQE